MRFEFMPCTGGWGGNEALEPIPSLVVGGGVGGGPGALITAKKESKTGDMVCLHISKYALVFSGFLYE